MSRFRRALFKENIHRRPPVWFMRQAGRYHSHYQKLKEKHSFMELCRKPELACETTFGPMDDFGFDAAILFSDLLFPLEAMGMGLTYVPGPQLGWHLKEKKDLEQLKSYEVIDKDFFDFQGKALELIRDRLPVDKGLLGFVGGPLTLFFYAVEGSHKGDLSSAIQGMNDGRWDEFCEKLLPILAREMQVQAEAGADVIAILDTCAGEISPSVYENKVVPVLNRLVKAVQRVVPDSRSFYYSKGTSWEHWEKIENLPIYGMGIDWNTPIAEVLDRYHDKWAIQGNVDPNWLFLDPSELESRLRKVFQSVLDLGPEKRRGWISGLGHGVLPKTPEENVRLFLRIHKEMFPDDRTE